LIATFVEKQAWSHRQSLLQHVSIYDPPVRDRIAAIVRALVANGSTLIEAQRQAYGALEGMVVKQTFLLTYMDAFRIVGISFSAAFRCCFFSSGAAAPQPRFRCIEPTVSCLRGVRSLREVTERRRRTPREVERSQVTTLASFSDLVRSARSLPEGRSLALRERE
jgi:hypothetical protein